MTFTGSKQLLKAICTDVVGDKLQQYSLPHIMTCKYDCFIRVFLDDQKTGRRLDEKIKQVTGNKKTIVQTAVDLMQLDNRLLDLRGEMQRGSDSLCGPIKLFTAI